MAFRIMERKPENNICEEVEEQQHRRRGNMELRVIAFLTLHFTIRFCNAPQDVATIMGLLEDKECVNEAQTVWRV